MAADGRDPRAPIDPAIGSPGREGLAGTAPASFRAPSFERDQITIAPDFAPADAQPAWRQDFPIDWPQDLYVERRDFLKFLVLTSAAFTAGQAWIAIQNWNRRRSGRPPVLRVAAIDAVPIGGSLVFRYPDEHEPCLLVRLTAGDFVAFNQKCTHLSCAVIPRPEEGSFFCPCHEGRFDLRTGVPIAGPPKRPLTRIVLERRGAEIFAVGVEERTT
jgi:Rieske Fe-S protein